MNLANTAFGFNDKDTKVVRRHLTYFWSQYDRFFLNF